MNLTVNKEECDLLLALVDGRVRELHPEIRRSMDHRFRDDLKHELSCYEVLLERLKTLHGNGA